MILNHQIEQVKKSLPDFYYEMNYLERIEAQLYRNAFVNNYSKNNLEYLSSLFDGFRPDVLGEASTNYLQHIYFNDIVERTLARSMLEIGFNGGIGTIAWILSGMKYIQSIDIFKCPGAEAFILKRFPNQFNFLAINSKELEYGMINRTFDLIFVDGGHDYDTVWNDIIRGLWFSPKYFLFDDVHSLEVRKGINIAQNKLIPIKEYHSNPPMLLCRVNPNPVTPLNSTFTI